MSKKRYLSTLKILLLTIIFYLAIEGLIHLSGVKTAGLSKVIPEEILPFIVMFTRLWGASALFSSWVMWLIMNDFKKYHLILTGTAFVAVAAGFSLIPIYSSTFESTLPLQNMYLWIPYYSKIVLLQILYIFSYAGFIFYGKYKNFIPGGE